MDICDKSLPATLPLSLSSLLVWVPTLARLLRTQPVALASSGAGGSAAGEALLTVKYLSSPVLLRLQLSDAAARRHFCLQARRPACRLSRV